MPENSTFSRENNYATFMFGHLIAPADVRVHTMCITRPCLIKFYIPYVERLPSNSVFSGLIIGVRRPGYWRIEIEIENKKIIRTGIGHCWRHRPLLHIFFRLTVVCFTVVKWFGRDKFQKVSTWEFKLLPGILFYNWMYYFLGHLLFFNIHVCTHVDYSLSDPFQILDISLLETIILFLSKLGKNIITFFIFFNYCKIG